MSIIANDFSDGEILTAARMNALAEAVNDHDHEGTAGSALDFNNAITNKLAQYVSTGRAGSGGGTGRGDTVQNHIDTVGSATASDNNPHGIEYGYLGDFTVTDKDKNNRYFWVHPTSIIWYTALDGYLNGTEGDTGTPGSNGMTYEAFPAGAMVGTSSSGLTGLFTVPYLYPANSTSGKIRVYVFFFAYHTDAGTVKIKLDVRNIITGLTFDNNASGMEDLSTAGVSTYNETLIQSGITDNHLYVARFSFLASEVSAVNRDLLRIEIERDSTGTATTPIGLTGVMVCYYVGRPVSG